MITIWNHNRGRCRGATGGASSSARMAGRLGPGDFDLARLAVRSAFPGPAPERLEEVERDVRRRADLVRPDVATDPLALGVVEHGEGVVLARGGEHGGGVVLDAAGVRGGRAFRKGPEGGLGGGQEQGGIARARRHVGGDRPGRVRGGLAGGGARGARGARGPRRLRGGAGRLRRGPGHRGGGRRAASCRRWCPGRRRRRRGRAAAAAGQGHQDGRRQDAAPHQRAFSRKRSTSTTTRVTLATAIIPHLSVTATVNVSRRPSVFSSVTSAFTVASSTRASTRGVPSTGTSPEWSAMAVSASCTTMATEAVRPARSGIWTTLLGGVPGLQGGAWWRRSAAPPGAVPSAGGIVRAKRVR